MSSSNGVVERDLSMTLATLSATLNTCDNIAYEREISAKIALHFDKYHAHVLHSFGFLFYVALVTRVELS